jgi:endoglucanase
VMNLWARLPPKACILGSIPMNRRGHNWRLLVIVAILIIWAGSSLAAASDHPWYLGVNLAGAEFNSKRIPGKVNKDYVYPTGSDIDYFLDRGMNTIRLPFLWERLQQNLGQPLEVGELERLNDAVSYITSRGAYVILDPHNYGHYFGKMIGSDEVPVSAFSAFWAALAERYRDNKWVIFGLMNEPHDIDPHLWRGAVDAAIAAIRATGALNLILVPGTAWTGAHSWTKARDGKSNAEAFRTLNDPAKNIAFEVHQYFDSNYSGTVTTCQSETIGIDTLKDFTEWLRDNGHRGFLGEFAAADNPVCLAALDNMLRYISANEDVWIGWTYWAAGAWWDNYPFSVQPSRDGDAPQMRILMKFVNPRSALGEPTENLQRENNRMLEGSAGRLHEH